MKLCSQFGAAVCGLLLGAMMVPGGLAQTRTTSDRPPANQQRPANPPARQSGSYHPQNSSRPQNSARGGNTNRPSGNARANPDRPGSPRNNGYNGGQNHGAQNGRDARNNTNRNGGQGNDRPTNQARQPAIPPPNVQERLRNLSPQEKSRLVENQRKFNQLPPQKQQEMRQAGDNWRKLTPEQQNHIKNDLMPRWQQMPAERQRAIQQRLGVLRNMPESARNRHLDDPNFTRGMSDDDKQMLRDLSHEHVGAPDRP